MATRQQMDDEFFGTPLSAAMNMPFNLERGDIVLGRISQIDEEFVYVSTGFKSEGRIPRSEFVRKPDMEMPFKVDDELEVMVDRISGEEIFLSYAKVQEQRLWDEYAKKHESGEPIDAVVLKMVKGGFRLDVGVHRHAFLPASHWGGLMPQSSEEVEGREIRVVIIEINRESGNIVVSQKDLMKKETAEKEDELFSNLQPDSIIEGKVTRLTNFGAFVDVGGAEGLVHISEIAWTRVGHPSQVLSCGDVVKVIILDIDNEKKKISLSMKQAQQDPWENVENVFHEGEIIEGTVARVVKYGMFVKLNDDFEGLLHNSEMPGGDKDQKNTEPGDTIRVKVLQIDRKGRRLKLGLAEPRLEDVSSDMKRYIDDGKSNFTLGDQLKGTLDQPGE